MACEDNQIVCDVCGAIDPLWSKFCISCGLDVCKDCVPKHIHEHLDKEELDTWRD